MSNSDSTKSGNPRADEIVLRNPVSEDGMNVYKLVAACPPLDTNSSYCNLLQCSHFASTSVAATLDGELVGFISGYVIPERPDTVFVWQVAVGEAARGCGLATKMIKFILSQPACEKVSFLETTITEDNKASWALFTGAAKKLDAEISSSVFFDKDTHFQGEHDSEMLVRIGPFSV
ncbi:diaminobutyrate acetyltransferase [Pseudomaricurvus sp.]|uniref:diaminobutyrate acetyltransferase n=1 Tax=Pseudomaricurvus sp. TaxID=2004510 RepID=UPI003F6B779E